MIWLQDGEMPPTATDKAAIETLVNAMATMLMGLPSDVALSAVMSVALTAAVWVGRENAEEVWSHFVTHGTAMLPGFKRTILPALLPPVYGAPSGGRA